MKLLGIVTISLLCILLMMSSLSCAKGSNNGMPSPTPTTPATSNVSTTSTLSPTPTATLGPEGCEPDRDAIQVALNAYQAENGDWPTADGDPGDIKWSKLVPDFLPYIPHTDSDCDWQVDSNPIGTICLVHQC
jgi:hypothetical protein